MLKRLLVALMPASRRRAMERFFGYAMLEPENAPGCPDPESC